MTNRFLKLTFTTLLVSSLIACSSGSGTTSGDTAGAGGDGGPEPTVGPTEPQPIVKSGAEKFIDLEAKYNELAGSNHAALPTSGSADFKGYGAVTVRNQKDASSKAVMTGVGEFNMSMNFAPEVKDKKLQSAMTGSLKNIKGYHGTTQEVEKLVADKAARKDIAGELTFSNGKFRTGKDGKRISQFLVDYSGTLTADNSAFNISGDTEANSQSKFMGTTLDDDKKPNGIKGLQIIDMDGAATKSVTASDKTVTKTEHGAGIDIYADKSK